MKLQVRYFAAIREALGPGETVEIAVDATVGAVRDALVARGGSHAEVLSRPRALRTALDKVMCDEAAVPGKGAELAFFPPVTGG